MEDRLIIGVSTPDGFINKEDVPVLTVMRIGGDKRSVLKSFTGSGSN